MLKLRVSLLIMFFLFVFFATGRSSTGSMTDIGVRGAFGPVSLTEFGDAGKPLVGFWYGYWVSVPEDSIVIGLTEAILRIKEADGTVLNLPTTTLCLKPGEDQILEVASYGADIPGRGVPHRQVSV